MSIIKEYKNYSEVSYSGVSCPVIRRDDLLLELPNPSSENITIDGKTFSYSKLYRLFGIYEHISNYYDPWEADNNPKSHYIMKTKKGRYLHFYGYGHSGYYGLGIAITNNTNNFNRTQSADTFWLFEVDGTGRGAPRIALLEIGEYIGIACSRDIVGSSHPCNILYVAIKKSDLENILGDFDSTVYDDEFGGVSDSDGYDPNFDNSSDIISIPSTPVIGVSNVGFVNVYRPTQGALQNLGADLFPDFEELPEVQPDDDVLVMLSQGFEHLGKNISTLLKSYINSNLINYIIDCHCLPVTPTTGESENIKIGFKSFDQTAQRVTSDYVDFDCGSLNIKEYYGNFIDYIGTRASLYLPFVGFVPIKNEYWQSGTLSVKYRFNVIDGSFMAYVLATSSKSNLKDTVIGTYSGNACVHIPITGVNYANMVSGVVTGGASLIGGVATGNVGLAVSGALNTLSSKPQMQSSNSYNSTSSFLGIRYPYLLIEREVSNFSELYPNENGLPLNVTKTISELSGYVQMDDNIHININCMDEEKEMLKGLLTSGIII